jgi:hypothetical protein
MKVPLAGCDAAGRPTETLLSEVGAVLLGMFSTAEACALRLICREFLEAVRAHQWCDSATVIHGSIAAWRACFPRARAADVSMCGEYGPEPGMRTVPVVDADIVHFAGLRELRMPGCTAVTGATCAPARHSHAAYGRLRGRSKRRLY